MTEDVTVYVTEKQVCRLFNRLRPHLTKVIFSPRLSTRPPHWYVFIDGYNRPGLTGCAGGEEDRHRDHGCYSGKLLLYFMFHLLTPLKIVTATELVTSIRIWVSTEVQDQVRRTSLSFFGASVHSIPLRLRQYCTRSQPPTRSRRLPLRPS